MDAIHAILKPMDVEQATMKVDHIPPHGAQSKAEQDGGLISMTVPRLLPGSRHQPLDFLRREIFPRSVSLSISLGVRYSLGLYASLPKQGGHCRAGEYKFAHVGAPCGWMMQNGFLVSASKFALASRIVQSMSGRLLLEPVPGLLADLPE